MRGLILLLCFGFNILFAYGGDAEGSGIDGTTLNYEKMWPVLKQPWYFTPVGIAIDSSGHIYVVDHAKNQIHKLSFNGAFVKKWGGTGTEDGKFNFPLGIAVDSSDHIYVTDMNNHRIQKFTSDGVFVAKWGFNRSWDGEFYQPAGIAVDSSDHIYVVDMNNDRIQKFTSNGEFLLQWGSAGAEDGEFDEPASIAVDSSGNVYVTERKNYRIQKFSPDGVFINKWGTPGVENGEFDEPVGIVADSSDHIYVVDMNNYRIQKFSSDGDFLTKWGFGGMKDGDFFHPMGIAVDASDHIYVADTKNHRVQKFNSDGTFVNKWGSIGSEERQFSNPCGVTVDVSGNIYIADTGNGRIQKFSQDGLFVMQWKSLGAEYGEIFNPFGIALDASSGNVLVSNTNLNRIEKYTSEGEFLSKWGVGGTGRGELNEPTGIAVDGAGNVYVVDMSNHRVQKFTASGKFIAEWGTGGTKEGEFNTPFGIAVDSRNNVYVADTLNNRIQKFTSGGSFIEAWGTWGKNDGQFFSPNGIAVDVTDHIYVADTANNRIQKFTSNGSFVSTFGELGSDPGQLCRPVGISLGKNNKVHVLELGNNRIQVFSQSDLSKRIAKAVIVAGGGEIQGNTLWNATQLCANYSYRVLTYKGYTKNTIYYMSSDTDLDLDGNSIPDDVDSDATNDNLHKAITQWAADADDLTLFITDHGGDKRFRMGESEVLEASELNQWLDQFQASSDARVTIVYDACQSGSFLPVLSSSLYDRIFIASASEDQNAYFTATGTISFSSFFWDNIFNGMSLYDAYLTAKNAIQYSYSRQTPLLDANGNGIADEDSDFEMIKGVHLGFANVTISAADVPLISAISPEITLSGEATAMIFAENIIATNDIESVWAVITPPDSGSADPSVPVLHLPTVELSKSGEYRYEGEYRNFTQKGTYNIAVFARNTKGILSMPKSTSLIQTEGQSPEYAVVDSDLSISIPSVTVRSSCYHVTLEWYDDSSVPEKILWKLDTVEPSPCMDNNLTKFNDDMSFVIPMLEYEQTFFNVTLKYYNNPNDMMQLPYWMLDQISVIQ